MAGYREFRQGEVWFYYNPSVSKELERKKELGAITSRPVVIIQDAYYPEWTDYVAVVPMTSSDRRSGVFIETTILADGSLLEGGTILPYCIYTVKKKFLHAMSTDNRGNKIHCVSLSRSDWLAVRQGVAYHLGLSDKEPEYVKNWTSLSDYERNVVTRTVHVAVEDLNKHMYSYPRLIQTPTKSSYVENHVIAAYDKMDRTHSTFDMTGRESTGKTEDVSTDRPNHETTSLLFKDMQPDEFFSVLYEHHYKWKGKEPSNLFPGSYILHKVPYTKVEEFLSPNDLVELVALSLSEIMELTGVTSRSTASRMRSRAKMIVDNPDFTWGSRRREIDGFFYSEKGSINRARLKRNARRRSILFQHPKEELLKMLPMEVSELQHMIPKLSVSSLWQLKLDIATMYPDETTTIYGVTKLNRDWIEVLQSASTQSMDHEIASSYELWETLSKNEVAEIASASKRNALAIAKKYGLNKGRFNALRGIAIELSRKGSMYKQPEIDSERVKIAILNVIRDTKLQEVSFSDMLIYCRSDYSTIMDCYGEVKSPNTPSKNDIAAIKRTIRKIIGAKTPTEDGPDPKVK